MAMYTHRTWEPDLVFDLNTEDGLVRNLLLLSAQYYNSVAQRPTTLESTPRPLGKKGAYSVEGFLFAALRGDRIAMPIPGARILLHTADFANAVGEWDGDMRPTVHNCGHYEHTRFEDEEDGNAIGKCKNVADGGDRCYKQPDPDCGFVNKRFGKELPRPLSKIVEYVVSGKASEDRAKEIEEAEKAEAEPFDPRSDDSEEDQ